MERALPFSLYSSLRWPIMGNWCKTPYDCYFGLCFMGMMMCFCWFEEALFFKLKISFFFSEINPTLEVVVVREALNWFECFSYVFYAWNDDVFGICWSLWVWVSLFIRLWWMSMPLLGMGLASSQLHFRYCWAKGLVWLSQSMIEWSIQH